VFKHDLFWELEAFDPRWQTRYSTIKQAAEAAGVMLEYHSWLSTAEGKTYRRAMRGVPDTLALIAEAQAAADRAPIKMNSLPVEI
jgi:hypothetical protein